MQIWLKSDKNIGHITRNIFLCRRQHKFAVKTYCCGTLDMFVDSDLELSSTQRIHCCFFIAKVFKRERHNFMLHVRCLFC